MHLPLARDLVEHPSPEAEAHAHDFLSGNQGLTFGPYILSLWINGALFGTLLMQFYKWCKYSRPNEKLFISTIVYLVLLGSLVDSVFVLVLSADMRLFAYNFAKYAPFQSTKWLGWPPVIDGVIGVACQMVYVDRAYRLNKRNIFIPLIAGSLMLACLAGALATLVSFWKLKTESEAGKINGFVNLWLATTIAIDLFIVIFVSIGLWRSRTGWSNTDWIIKKLIILALETQLGPTIVTLAWLIAFAIHPPSSLGVFFSFTQSKVYAVALLAVLNTRLHLREVSQQSTIASGKHNSFPLSARPHQTTVHIDREVFTHNSSVATPQSEKTVFSVNRDFPPQDKLSNNDLEVVVNDSKIGLTSAPAFASPDDSK